MTMRMFCAAVVTIGIAATGIAVGQQPPTRDINPGPAAVGTASISGTIVTDDASAQPVRRATLRMIGSDSSGARIGVTDDAGRFVFSGLPAGSFSISASRAGYVTVFYGGKRPGRGPSVPIALAEGQRANVTLKMMRGAAITGTLVDPHGRPAPQVLILLLNAKAASGAVSGTTLVSSAGTDDRGVYRIFGLPPGDYIVAATPQALTGTGDTLSMSAEEIQWALHQSSGRADPSGRPAPIPPPAKAISYTPVFFPGTISARSATRITLGPGEERRDANFALQFVATSTIEGTVVDSAGRPAANAAIEIEPSNVDIDSSMIQLGAIGTMRGASDATGRFSLGGLPPGSFRVLARIGVLSSAEPLLWGEVNVTVNGGAQTGLVVQLQPGLTIAGRIAFDGTALKPPDDATRVRLVVTRVNSPKGPTFASYNANADGTFLLPNFVPGQYTIRPALTGPTPGGAWTLKSVMASGKDVADQPLVLRSGENVTGVVATFTDRATEVSGTLFDAANRPTPEFSILIFSTDRASWVESSRRTKITRPASNGTFRIAGLPAGEYFLAAVSDFEPEDLFDPGFLEQVQAVSAKITLADGERKTQSLRIAGGY